MRRETRGSLYKPGGGAFRSLYMKRFAEHPVKLKCPVTSDSNAT